jgi:hypothetical protein
MLSALAVLIPAKLGLLLEAAAPAEITVESRNNLAALMSLPLAPQLRFEITRIFDVAEVGVIETLKPVTSPKVVDDIENVSVLVVLTTCNTLPAGKPVVVALVSTVPVASGSVSVLFVFVMGANRVTVPVPVAEAVTAMLLMLLLLQVR